MNSVNRKQNLSIARATFFHEFGRRDWSPSRIQSCLIDFLRLMLIRVVWNTRDSPRRRFAKSRAPGSSPQHSSRSCISSAVFVRFQPVSATCSGELCWLTIMPLLLPDRRGAKLPTNFCNHKGIGHS